MAITDNDIRADLGAAIDKLEKEAAPPPPPPPEPEPKPEQKELPGTAPDAVKSETPVGDGKPVRDEKGRFVAAEPKPGEPPPVAEKPKEEVAPPTPPPAPPVPERKFRAPASWKPGVREGWDKVAPEIQQEVIRREREIDQVLKENAKARDGYQQFQEVVRPYEYLMRAEGVEPLQAVNNLFRTTAVLSTGTPQQKVQIAASIIRNYGIDIAMLDQALAGMAGPNGQMPGPAYQPPMQPQQPLHDPRLDSLLEQAGAQLDERAAAQIGEVENEEWFEDVRGTMADLLDAAANRGVAMTAKQAYDRAIALDPEINRIVEQRKAAANVKSTQQAIAAAASPKPQPAAGPQAGPAGNRTRWDDVAAAYDELAKSNR